MTEAKRGTSIITKLARIVGSLGAMERKGENTFHHYSYFTEDQLTAALRPKLAAENLFILTSVESIATEVFKNQKGNEERLVTVTTSHVIYDGETGGKLVARGVGMGADAGDKGAYKAVTGAMKYFLMKNFLISDNADPEGDVAADKARATKHSPTRDNASRKTADTPTAKADLASLRNWAEENGVTEEFILKLAAEGKLANSETSLAELKPGTLTRLLSLRERILTRWKLTDDGVATPADKENPDKEAESYSKNRKTLPPKESKAKVEIEGERKPVQTDIEPSELLEQEGVESWKDVAIHFGSKKGTKLGKLPASSLSWWVGEWRPKQYKNKWSNDDLILDAALCVAQAELANA